MSGRRSSLFFLQDKFHDNQFNIKATSPNNSHFFNQSKQEQSNLTLNLKQNSILNLTENFENYECQKRKSMQLTLQDIDKISAQVRTNYLHQESNVDFLMATATTSRQRKSFIHPTGKTSFHNTSDINSFRSSDKHCSKTKEIIPNKPKRIFKNSEDLFSHTLNFKAKKKNKITNDLLLKTQIRILNTKLPKVNNKDEIPIFDSATKLNDYLIKQYHLGNNSPVENSKKKQKIMQATFSLIKKKRKEEIDKENQSLEMMTIDNSYKYKTIEGNDKYPFITFNNDDDKDLNMKMYYDHKRNEKMKRVGIFLNKLENLSNKKYESLDLSTPINHNNLSRVIQLMKIKEKSKDDLNHQINIKKERLRDDQQMVILATSKLGPPVCAKLKVRNDTNIKYRGATESFFGYPV